MSVVYFIQLVSLLYSAYALKDLPEYARNGLAQKQFVKDELKMASSSEPQIWVAKIDNFNDIEDNSFNQRYYVDATYWKGDGPVFFEIGGEGTLTGPPGGYVKTLAQNYSALLISLEHRFYGESYPTPYNDNLKYLTVEQALADLNAFTAWYTVTNKLSSSNKWFVFGGSYPGALSSWYRIAYPDASVGSLSSSGVVDCIIDYHEFDEVVSSAIGNHCANNIRRIEAAFEAKVYIKNTKQVNEAGWNEVLNLFYCEKDMWVEDFFYMIADSWSMADQYSSKQQLCDAIDVDDSASDEVLMQTFANFSNMFWGSDFCAGGFYNTEALSDPARWTIDCRSWRYQTCAQVSYFNTAPSAGSLRSVDVNLAYHLKQCQAMFGTIFPESYEMNKRYGGATPTASKVFYSDFSDDPWRQASVTYPISVDQPYYLALCDGCGHCKDFATPQESDPQNLKNSRSEFEKYLNEWLQG